MRSRWSILALLFAIRATMAFQFQSVASVAPLLGRDFGVGLADIGVLIGLYFAPGIALALAGGAIGQRIGDKPAVLAGLALMFVGGLIMMLPGSWSGQIVGRLVAGTGGVLLNVLMTKMVADWFADKEISTAMAIFVNSWPFGLAISLLVLPSIGTAYGTGAVYLVVTVLVALGALLLAALYESPRMVDTEAVPRVPLDRKTAAAIVAAGLIWTLYNIAFAMIFSFGPSMLTERGWSIAAAGSAVSIVLWLAALSVPLGGYLADRSNRHKAILAASCALFALMLIVTSRTTAVLPSIVAMGVVCGLAAGPILSLPARVLAPATRAIGMGLFYSVFYIGMMLGSALGGWCAVWTGSAAGALDFGAAALVACLMVLWGFNRMAVTRAAPARVPS